MFPSTIFFSVILLTGIDSILMLPTKNNEYIYNGVLKEASMNPHILANRSVGSNWRQPKKHRVSNNNNHNAHVQNNVDDHEQNFVPENHDEHNPPRDEHNRPRDDSDFEDNRRKSSENNEDNSKHNSHHEAHHEGRHEGHEVKHHHQNPGEWSRDNWDNYHRSKYHHFKVKLHGPGKTPREWAEQEAQEMANMPLGDHYDSDNYNQH